MSRYQPYPEYKDSGVEWIGEIPAHWEVKKLPHVILSSNSGEVIDRGYWGSGEENLYTCAQESYDCNFFGFPDHKRTASGDLLLTRNGTPYVHEPEPGSIYTNVIQRIRPANSINSVFLGHALRSASVSIISYGVSIESLNFSMWASLRFPYPPKNEQDKIMDWTNLEATRLDTLIKKKERFIELLQEKRQALIKQAVTKGIDPNVPMKDSGVEWIGEVPAHWEIKKLSYLTRCHDGSRIPLNATERDSRKGSVPYWGASKIIDYVNESIFDEEVILIGEDGAPFFDKDRPVAFYSNGPIWPNNHVHILKAKDTFDTRFLVHVLNTTDYTFSVDGATRDKLTQSGMMQIPIQYPPESEKKGILKFIDTETTRIDTLIDRTRQSIDLLKERRSSLITAAVTGKIDVRGEAA